MQHFQKTSEFHSLEGYVQSIANHYFLAINNLKVDREDSESNSYIMRVRNAYLELDGVMRKFINNDFFYEDYPFWWKRYYSKATYYRLKRKSMLKFKEAFDGGQ